MTEYSSIISMIRNLSPANALLLLLLAGHFIADIPLQPSKLANRKRKGITAVLLHGTIVFAVQGALLFPFMCSDVAIVILILAVTHTFVDFLKVKIEGNGGSGENNHTVAVTVGKRGISSLRLFYLDQIIHTVIVVAAWMFLLQVGADKRLAFYGFDPSLISFISVAAIVAAGYGLNGKGGTIIVRKILMSYPDVLPDPVGKPQTKAGLYAMGKMIGNLERFLVFRLVLLGEWSAIGFILAAKSVARFRELESRDFADYYLIGTLASISISVFTGIAIRGLLLFLTAP